MKSLRSIRTLGLMMALMFVTVAQAAWSAEQWTENVSAAKTVAHEEHKRILLDFTGSDWCEWCKELDHEVFSTTAFKTYASKHLVLVKVDFPRSIPQSTEIKKQNLILQQQYAIEGYPTVIVLDADGKQIGKLGYMPGGPDAFIKALEALK
jgi:thioredoxin-related protein